MANQDPCESNEKPRKLALGFKWMGAVPVLEFGVGFSPCCCAETEQGEDAALGAGKVAQLGAGQRLVAEVVVAVDILVPQKGVALVRDEIEPKIPQFASGGANERLRLGQWCAADVCYRVRSNREFWRVKIRKAFHSPA